MDIKAPLYTCRGTKAHNPRPPVSGNARGFQCGAECEALFARTVVHERNGIISCPWRRVNFPARRWQRGRGILAPTCSTLGVALVKETKQSSRAGCEALFARTVAHERNEIISCPWRRVNFPARRWQRGRGILAPTCSTLGVALVKEASKPAVRWLRSAVCARGSVAKRDKPLLAETLGFPLPQKYCQW